MNAKTICCFLALSPLVFAAVAGAQLSSVGLSAVRAQVFFENSNGVYVPEPFDSFGSAVATGDFNGDGADDLATGIPYDDGIFGGGCEDCGAVVVRYGVANAGLETGVVLTFLRQSAGPDPEGATPGDQFGKVLATGDFNGDRFDDLAIGAPGNSEGADAAVGAVEIRYGSSSGIQLLGAEFISFNVLFPGAGNANDRFGASLAVGNFNGDSNLANGAPYDDLAIGAPHDNFPHPEAGGVILAHGSTNGLRPLQVGSFHQGSDLIPDDPEADDQFGYALASGDFNGDGFDDLAVGVPGEDEVGAQLVVFGSPFSLILANNRWFGEIDLGTPPEPGDRFGASLATGDFNGDGFDDLVVGAPGEGFGNDPPTPNVGLVSLLYGAPQPPYFNFAPSYGFWWEDRLGGQGSLAEDHFGWALAAGDFDGDGSDDLAIGHIGEDSFSGFDSGAVTVMMGTPLVFGLGAPPRYRMLVEGNQGFPGVPSQNGRYFGYALAAGDFDGDGVADLVAGAPGENAPGIPSAGAEVVLYGSLFSDGFDGSNTVYWSNGSSCPPSATDSRCP